MNTQFIKTPVQTPVPGLLATWVKRADDGPMRPIATGRRHRPVGSYYSVKNGQALAWESRNELHGFYHAEVRTDVVGYLAQPHTWEINADGRKLKFTSDLELHLANGATEIVEIKGVFDATADLDYTAKLDMVSFLCDRVGWSFRMIDQDALQAEPRFKAIEEIQSYRRTAINTADLFLVFELFAGRHGITLGDIKCAFSNPMLGMAKAYAMVVRRVIDIDFARGLSDSSPVRLVDREAGHA